MTALHAAIATGGPTGVLGEWAPPGYSIELAVRAVARAGERLLSDAPLPAPPLLAGA